VDQIVKESGFINDPAVIDAVVAAQLLAYHANGVYGSAAGQSGLQEIPELQVL